MSAWHGNPHKKKNTGGRRPAHRGKRAFEKGSPAAETRIGEKKVKTVRGRGKAFKHRLLAANVANVVDPSTGKVEKTEVKRVIENQSNREFKKRGIITKGAVLDTTAGKVKVTSRPGQDGVINGIIIERS